MKLHIGGVQRKDGWKVLNISAGEHVDFVGDIRTLGMFEAGSCTAVYASHVVEHVPQAHIVECLRGIHRILAIGGQFYVSVPDLDVLCRYFTAPNVDVNVKFHAMRMMFGGQVDAHDFHFMGWNQQFLAHFLREAGFSSFQRVDSFGLFEDTSDYAPYGERISLNVIATK